MRIRTHLSISALAGRGDVSPEVRRIGAAQLVSGLGSTGASLALYYLAFTGGGRASDAAIASAAWTVLYILGTLVSRTVAVRFDHRHVFVAEVALKAVIYCIPLVFALIGTVSLAAIVVTLGLAGLVAGVTQPAYYEVLQDLSPPNGVAVANAFIGSRFAVSAIVGALAGGVVFAAVGATWLFFVNVLSYLPLLWVVARLPKRGSGAKSTASRPPLGAALKAVFGTRRMRLGIVIDLLVIVLAIPTPLLTKLANGVGSSATYYGIVAAASSLGMALAMPFLTRLKRRRTAPGVVIGCIVALAVGSLLVGLLGAIGVSGVSGVILLAVAITVAFVGSYSAADKLLAVVQVTASATERAVAIATVSIVAMAAETVANLVEGVLADAIPVWWIQVVAGLLAAILATVGVVAKRRGWLPSEPAPAT